ncbi:dihydrolipoamide acetyltransferase family protein [Zavarzinella formosa]|uniref:dihydrolipoamide acetyltransferase family protein n=1 Tax=Zavarzinella formosa TaxID=360055 RepID=UPI0002F812B7|nr:dihydrolipoamide acetyltransferase family protein [Zavarzinella formosa]
MDFPLPELGEGVYEAELVRWLVAIGDTVKRSQPLLEVMTDKATMEVPSPFAGKITRLSGEPGQKLKVGDAVLGYELIGAKPEPVRISEGNGGTVFSPLAPVAAVSQSNGHSPRAENHLPVAAPSVRHLARKLGIDLGMVRGSGPSGRILIDDLTPLINRPVENSVKTASPTPKLDVGRPGTRIKLAGLRRRIAHHLVDAIRRIPHYSYMDECDVTDMVRLRQSLRDPCAKAGVKLTYLAFVIKAVTLGLKEVPFVNASLDDDAEEIVLHDRYNVGIAVATPTGLVVPVIHDADKKDVFAIAKEIEKLSTDAKNGKIRLEDLKGGTFTVTSIGNIGGLISTPIINHPEVGIIGIGKVVKRPVYDEHDQLRPSEIMYLSFSFDHRVVDGSVGATFGNVVKRHLENPATMLIPVE